MKSIYWSENHPNNLPSYDHDGQEEFFNEAMKWCNDSLDEIDKYNLRFKNDERTSQKATWMLFLNCLLQIRECLSLIKEHKIVSSSPLMREIWEKYHAMLFMNDKANQLALKSFYENKDYCFMDSKYSRNLNDKIESEKLKVFFGELSKFIHPNYVALREFFCVGGDNYEYIYSAYLTTFGKHKSDSGLSLLPPDKASQHFWVLAQIVKDIISNQEQIIKWIQ